MRKATRFLMIAALVLLVGAALYVTFRETPILVDLATVETAPLEVTVSEEGIARVRDVFTVSAPIAGQLERIRLSEGDRVVAGETVLATIRPLEPPFLDERARAELVAAVEAAQSAVALAQVEHARAVTGLKQAQSEYDRAARLAERNFLSESALERSESELRLQRAQVESAEANIRLRQAELASARARLTQPGDSASRPDPESQCCVRLTSPVDGVVLSVRVRSEQAVTPGTALVEIGDPLKLEVSVDLLSRDAVRVEAGALALIEDWGGDGVIEGRVRRVEPAAFTRVSALGIEEQRVNAVIDLAEVPAGLGHNYRVLVRLRVWREEGVAQLPIGALFRSGGAWAVFAVEEGRAHIRKVSIGRMNDQAAQLLDGIDPGARVILHPNDRLGDGSPVLPREVAGE